jgi:hypothetical protein
LGAFRRCYDLALPVETMLGAAMFDAQRPETHFLPWESLREWHIQFWGIFNQIRDTQYPPNNYMRG